MTRTRAATTLFRKFPSAIERRSRFSVAARMLLAATVAGLFGLLSSEWAEAESRGMEAFNLGPGDQILINVFGEPDLSMDFRLNDTGTLNYPFLGELQVAGLTVVELEQLITNGLKGPYLVDPEVSVSIKEYRPFFMHGEVEKPGGIPYQPGLTLEKAIALAGGFTERASKKKVTVVRAGDPAGASRSIQLSDPVRAGDVITVHQSFF